MHFFARRSWVRCLCAAAGWIGVAAAGAQPPAPEPAPKFDVQETPLTAGELAAELGYLFYGSTWKFSEPTFVRVRVWSSEGKAAEVSAQPPADARWSNVFAPDKPQTQLTVRCLEKTDQRTLDSERGGHTDVQMAFKINAAGKDAPEDTPSGKITMSGGQGLSITLRFVQNPNQGFAHEWRYANGNLGVVLAGAAAATTRPGTPGAVDASVREHVEEALRATPLNLCYFKGEISGLSDENLRKGSGPYDQPKKRAVCLVTLECSREPFKADAPTGDAKAMAGR